ncbi:HipA N-terminal domain-containing protein [Formosa sp. A9]|uniref:HipA N-terminal domain-containing protein n=1 Tax=Formosa sp. A9 TaxID=3442641 RepID=UPI003EBA6994
MLTEDENAYLQNQNVLAVSLSLPLQEEPFSLEYLFPFFDELIPEGWLLGIAHKIRIKFQIVILIRIYDSSNP